MHASEQMPYAPPPRGWFARNWLWFVPLVLLLPLVICAGLCAGILGMGYYAILNSDPYRLALEAVQKNPQVIEQLGKPIEGVRWPPPGGSVNIKDDRGEAKLEFKVRGPKGTADVEGNSRMVDGKWGLTSVTVKFADGKRVVVDTGQAAEGDAPKWDAPAGGQNNAPPKKPAKKAVKTAKVSAKKSAQKADEDDEDDDDEEAAEAPAPAAKAPAPSGMNLDIKLDADAAGKN